MKAELWLVRHGETEWSIAGKHTGSTDIPLTGRGSEVAATLRPRLEGIDFVRVLASPLLRARQTCELAGFGGRFEIDPDLHEWRYGSYEGRTSAEIREERPGWTVWKDGPVDGETIEAVAERTDRLIARVRSLDGRVAAFAHGHVSRVLAARWIGRPPADGALYRLDTAAISVLGWERDTPVLKLWNDTGKLPA